MNQDNDKIRSEVDHDKKTITFKYRSWMERGTRKKHFSIITISIYEFMARMLFYLPEQHSKSLRYYGLYASSYLKFRVERDHASRTWAAGIENSFEKRPEICPDCGKRWFLPLYIHSRQSEFTEISERITL